MRLGECFAEHKQHAAQWTQVQVDPVEQGGRDKAQGTSEAEVRSAMYEALRSVKCGV